MKTKIFILSLVLIAGSCINQRVTENDIFNPIKEYVLLKSFQFNSELIAKNDSVSLEVWYLTMPKAEFNLIYLSGNGSNIRSAISFFNSLAKQTNLNIFSHNYSGYGLSTGTPSIEGIIKDSEIALDYFNEIKNNNLPTIILGYSLGGFVAMQLSHLNSIDKVILMSTFSSAEELEDYLKKEALPKIARPFFKIDIDKKLYSLNNIDVALNLEKPLLVVHGEKDDFIPPRMGKKLFELSKSKQKYFVEIKGADHRTILKDDDKSALVATEVIRFTNSNQVVSR